ncbi:MAG: aminoglycoside phosphotransferase family protein [Planctomycetota bacterium]|nr:aminoglycoside phosphotransferase family protein [Planctomycetota bacterium]
MVKEQHPTLPVPTSEEEVTADWLRAALAESYPDLRIRSVESKRIGEGFGLSSRLFRFRWAETETPSSVVVKLWDTEGPAGIREIHFFREFGGQTGTRIPGFYHGAFDLDSKRGVLVLEDLGEVIQGDCLEQLELGRSEMLARSLAGLHAAWWQREELESAKWLPLVTERVRGSDWFESRRTMFLGRFEERLDRFCLELLSQIERAEARANERLGGAAVTLLHADLHLDNVVFETEAGRPILLDWARTAKGPAVLDLADLLYTIALPEDREEVFSTYLSELASRGVAELDEQTVRHQLGGALLRKFDTWTCGVGRWQPASERESRMIDSMIKRALQAISDWRSHDPDLFRF